MRKAALFWLFFVLAVFSIAAQQKYALVIGNSAYRNLTPLNNPVNDANDVTAALGGLGFTVETVINGSRIQMEEAIERFKDWLSLSRNTYGFLFYAGHGVQSGGVNYLIPVDADIRSESYLADRAVSVQAMLGEINQAGNELNIVVLDACRDNPFGWSRSGSRGLQVVSNQPADSIIVYATAAGMTAADGEDRNSPYTKELLKNLQTPGLEVNEVFRRTGGDVTRASGGSQIPAIYSQFFGIAYLGSPPSVPAAQPAVTPLPMPVPQPAVDRKQPGVIGYGMLNLMAGLGSFIQRDVAGGVTLLAGYGAAAGLIAWELTLNYDDRMAGIPGGIGLGVAGVTVLYGFIRPAIYQKNRRLAGIADRVNIAVVPENRNVVRLSYTLQF
jgi:hypothetical protein